MCSTSSTQARCSAYSMETPSAPRYRTPPRRRSTLSRRFLIEELTIGPEGCRRARRGRGARVPPRPLRSVRGLQFLPNLHVVPRNDQCVRVLTVIGLDLAEAVLERPAVV